MGNSKKLITVGLSIAVLAMSQFSGAQAEKAEQAFDFKVANMDLMVALQALSVQTGLQYSIQTTNVEFRKVTVNLIHKTVDEAMRYICDAAGASVERDATGVYIIRSVKEAPKTPEATPGVKKPTIMKKILLMHADPEYVYSMVFEGGVMKDKLYYNFQDLKQFTEGVAIKSTITPGTITDVGRQVNQINATPSVIPAVQPNNEGNGIVLPGEEANQRGGGGGGLSGGGGNFGGGGQNFGGGGQNGGGLGGGQNGGGGGVGLQGGQGFVPSGITNATYDPIDNSIVVQGSEDAIRELERIIEQFDKAPKQVHVDVKFITTSNSIDKSLGIDWLYSRGGIFAGNRPGSFARNNDPIFINYATGNLTTRLRTLLNEGWGRVVNNPSITTPNNQPAAFTAVTTTTVFTNQIVGSNGGIIIVPQPNTISITNGIQVRPRINGDGTVTMGLTPQIADFGQIRRGPDGSEIPDQLQQAIAVVVRVKSGETIALGGLTRKLDNYSRSKIPVLGDLPIIGQLFQGRNSQQTTQDLTIFVTPTILEDQALGINP